MTSLFSVSQSVCLSVSFSLITHTHTHTLFHSLSLPLSLSLALFHITRSAHSHRFPLTSYYLNPLAGTATETAIRLFALHTFCKIFIIFHLGELTGSVFCLMFDAKDIYKRLKNGIFSYLDLTIGIPDPIPIPNPDPNA